MCDFAVTGTALSSEFRNARRPLVTRSFIGDSIPSKLRLRVVKPLNDSIKYSIVDSRRCVFLIESAIMNSYNLKLILSLLREVRHDRRAALPNRRIYLVRETVCFGRNVPRVEPHGADIV